jgi:hypothetical protein
MKTTNKPKRQAATAKPNVVSFGWIEAALSGKVKYSSNVRAEVKVKAEITTIPGEGNVVIRCCEFMLTDKEKAKLERIAKKIEKRMNKGL